MDSESTKVIGHLNNPSGEIVKVARELLDQLRTAATTAELRAEALRQELEAERAKPIDERLTDAGALITALKEIVDHAVANLSPEFIRDIPAEMFAAASALVDKVVGATQRDTERAAVWRDRARVVNDWRSRRGTPEWAERVAEYKERQLREQTLAAGYRLVKQPKAKAKAKARTKAKTKTKRRPPGRR